MAADRLAALEGPDDPAGGAPLPQTGKRRPAGDWLQCWYIIIAAAFLASCAGAVLAVVELRGGTVVTWARSCLLYGAVAAPGWVGIILWRTVRQARRQRAFRDIEGLLEQLDRQGGQEDVPLRLEAAAVSAKMSAAARGWNRLVSAWDGFQDRLYRTQSEDALGQFLCSYDSQRLLGILEILPDGVVLLDEQGTIILANRACEGKVSKPLGEFIGRSVLELFPDENAQRVLQRILAKQTLGAEDHFEVVLLGPHLAGVESDGDAPGDAPPPEPGPEKTAQTASSLEQRLQAGSAVLWVCCYRINQEKDNSEILMILRDVTQQKIQQYGRDMFVAHVSHELRSPLTNIRAYTETLLSDMILDAAAQKESFNVIHEETNRLIRLVNDILDLSRMESGSMQLERGEVVLDRLVRQCVNDVRAGATAKKITLQTTYHPKLPNLYADREKLAVVLNNILSNAIKYTPSGGTIFVETNVDDRYVFLKVTDTGIGIAEKDLDRIFSRFYRVDRRETADIPGSGLGLAITKEIVTLHGGAINVVSELNKGTEMEVKLPLTTVGPVLGSAQSRTE
ncbi:MAG: PAS domain-containing protein [Sedimentisphaerales bacterium]|nr:PAS domain-containing protein [Sedimentisphaerales bacterium]